MKERRLAHIAYGKGRIPLHLDESIAEWQVIAPASEPALPDSRDEFAKACRAPIGSRPLRDMIQAHDRVTIVTSDGTRPVPNRQLIPWILEELPVPIENVTVLLGTGTHRPNTPAEIASMFGEEIVRSVRIVNHSAFDAATNTLIGQSRTGGQVVVDNAYLDADKTIVVGFIEPHFFAGFSGGPKGVIPGVGGIDTILHLHRYDLIAHPQSTYGVLDGNPIHAEISEMVGMCPPDFMVNVTLNSDKEITGFFVGDYHEAHRAGCRIVREKSMAPVEKRFPIVITSNSGFPLDQNLYQTVKGISAAARIVEQGGVIFVVSECSDGLPSHGNFGRILSEGSSAAEIIQRIRDLQKPILDQWQAQILSSIMLECDVRIFSGLDPGTVDLCSVNRIESLESKIRESIAAIGSGARVAILPDGPLTIPYALESAN